MNNQPAVKKVVDVVPIPEKCRYCSSPVVFVNNSTIYGKSYGKWPYAYTCTACDAYVGVHPNTSIPLGSLADKALRQSRKTAKKGFYMFVRDLRIPIGEAYKRLAKAMDIPQKECHFGMFDHEQCVLATAALKKLFPLIQKEKEDR